MEFLRSVLAQDEAITESTRVTYDLPVNPLSHILITLKFCNNTATVSNYTLVEAALKQITNISVEFKGSAIVSMSFADLAMYSQILLRHPLGQNNFVRLDNTARSLTVTIPFSRQLFNPDECLPAVRRGDLRLVIDYAAAQTGIDTLIAQIETVELPGAAPKQFLKATTSSKTMTSGIGNDIDLPIGNPIIGILLFSTTVPSAGNYEATLGKIKLLVDNVESHFSECNWETLHNELCRRFPWTPENDAFTVGYNGADTSDNSSMQPEGVQSTCSQYAYLDFDPNDNGVFVLTTEGRSRVHLRIMAEADNDARIIPIELMQIAATA